MLSSTETAQATSEEEQEAGIAIWAIVQTPYRAVIRDYMGE